MSARRGAFPFGYFKLCKRFGWTMTSAMPQRYIDREGVDELEMAEAHLQAEKQRGSPPVEELRAELAEHLAHRSTDRLGQAHRPQAIR